MTIYRNVVIIEKARIPAGRELRCEYPITVGPQVNRHMERIILSDFGYVIVSSVKFNANGDLTCDIRAFSSIPPDIIAYLDQLSPSFTGLLSDDTYTLQRIDCLAPVRGSLPVLVNYRTNEL